MSGGIKLPAGHAVETPYLISDMRVVVDRSALGRSDVFRQGYRFALRFLVQLEPNRRLQAILQVASHQERPGMTIRNTLRFRVGVRRHQPAT